MLVCTTPCCSPGAAIPLGTPHALSAHRCLQQQAQSKPVSYAQIFVAEKAWETVIALNCSHGQCRLSHLERTGPSWLGLAAALGKTENAGDIRSLQILVFQ